jgi:hypothetical protein
MPLKVKLAQFAFLDIAMETMKQLYQLTLMGLGLGMG